jgi:hypothetical protein
MSNLALILVASVFEAISMNALAEELPKRRSMADICPSNIMRMKVEAPDDLVIRIPPNPVLDYQTRRGRKRKDSN